MRQSQPYGIQCLDSCTFPRDLCEQHHQGVIVERIIDVKSQRMIVDKTLELCGLPPCLHPPLSLWQIDVTDIRPACAPSGCEKMKTYDLSLICHVIDALGKRERASACIQIDLSACEARAPKGSSLRLGAQIKILCASFQSCSLAFVRLDICIKSIISDCAAFLPREREKNIRPSLPLYPRITPPKKRRTPYKCPRGRKSLDLHGK